MTLQWIDNPITVVPYIQLGSVVKVRGNKNLGGGENRVAATTITWYGDSNTPAESVLFADVEAMWDMLVTAGYTIMDASVTNPGGIELDMPIEKA